jgi:acetoacetyl-CoA synthetase
MTGEVLWTPPSDARERTELGRFLDWVRDHRGLELTTYDEAWRWSVRDLEGFWSAIWEFFGVRSHAPHQRVLGSRRMPGAEWFPGATLNYAEHMLGGEDDTDRLAVLARSQTRGEDELTFGELRDRVARARTGLERLGVQSGDRVVAYLPNIPETLVAFLATASLGAIWATCAPEFGERAVIDRFAQIGPKVLLTITGYRYGDNWVDRLSEAAAIRDRLPTLEATVQVPYGEGAPLPDAVLWGELLAEPGPLQFEPLPFTHPLYVLFSSGTTGLPKAIVHGHGGILLEHFKTMGLQWNLRPGERILWFTTTAWMMWNALVSALLVRATIVLIDGNPGWPSVDGIFRMAEETQPALLGLSPAYIAACRKAAVEPGRDYDLSSVTQVGCTGSPLPPEGFAWVYEQLPRVLLNVGSGGTDVCAGFVGNNTLLPVRAGEMAHRFLGVDAHAYDPQGQPVIDELGELVIVQPMPSMPVGFWDDPDGRRYRTSYFETYPGVWRHGDWIVFAEDGSSMVTGRSDATLNRGGVRLGTGDFYAVVEELEEVVDSVVVHLEGGDGIGELLLFVVLRDGVELDGELQARIVGILRSSLSPRHVPDTIVAVPAVPRTLTGKKLELPVKRILQGIDVHEVASADALADPSALDAFVAYAAERG